MSKLKNQITVFVLFFSLFAPLIVTIIWLQHEKTKTRQEVKWKLISGIDKENLVLLKFTLTEYLQNSNLSNSKEFEYHGQMYDLVEKEIKGNNMWLWCWEDRKETSFDKKLNDLVVGAFSNNPQNKDTQERLNVFFKSFFFTSITKDIFTQNQVLKIYADISIKIKTPANPPSSPPPQMS